MLVFPGGVREPARPLWPRTFSPPVIMMSWDARPHIRYPPSSREATSPVQNHPSSENASRVAPALRQYSRKTLGPRTCISPGLPRPAGPPCSCRPVSSWRSSSTSLVSTPGNGHPHMSRRSLAVEWVRQRHAYLGHAVPLQEPVAGDLVPLFECAHHQRVRARHHEPEFRRADEHDSPTLGISALPLTDECIVGGRHRHEEGDARRRSAVPIPDGARTTAASRMSRQSRRRTSWR